MSRTRIYYLTTRTRFHVSNVVKVLSDHVGKYIVRTVLLHLFYLLLYSAYYSRYPPPYDAFLEIGTRVPISKKKPTVAFQGVQE